MSNKIGDVLNEFKGKGDSMVDDLKIVDGVVMGDHFYLRGISGHSVYAKYKADGLRNMARLINDEPFNFIIDDEKKVRLSRDEAVTMHHELNKVADYLEGSS